MNHFLNDAVKLPPVWLVVLLGVLQTASGPLYAQNKDRLSRPIIVGELVGRTDYRESKILTKNGWVAVKGNDNDKPFSIKSLSPDRIVLRYHPSAELKAFNPNTVVIQFYETERSLMSALILDEVDVAVLESEASALEVRKSNSHALPLPVQMEQNAVKLIVYNHRRKLLASPGIRQAISYGINHDYIVKKMILGGKASLARGPFDDDSPLYNPGMQSYKYDPRLALQMLWKMGWRDKNKDGVADFDGETFVLDLYYQQGVRLDEAISRIIKIDMIRLGIDVQPKPLTKQQINDKLASGDFDAVLLDHVFPDKIESLQAFFSAEGAQNFMNYRSSTVEKYIQFYYQSEDKQLKKTLIKSIQSVVNQDQPVTFLYFKWLTHYLVNINRFENFRYTDGPNRGKIRPFEEWIFKTPNN